MGVGGGTQQQSLLMRRGNATIRCEGGTARLVVEHVSKSLNLGEVGQTPFTVGRRVLTIYERWKYSW